MIDFKSKPRFRTQIKTEETQRKSDKDSVTNTMVDYVEKSKHSFSTVVNGKNKMYVLHIKGEEYYNADTAVHMDITTEEDSHNHHANKSVKCTPPYTPLLYSKNGVYRGIHYFIFFTPKHRLWVLVRTASLRRF